jgi:hypothetical protein
LLVGYETNQRTARAVFDMNDVGFMVIWLKSKVDADYLLLTGTAVFGETDAFCSPFIIRDNSGRCYHCNTDRHKQAPCY